MSSDKDSGAPLSAREAYKRTHRFLINRMTLAEFKSFCFIVERTYGFDKEEEVIPIEVFMKGIPGTCVGTDLSDKTIRTALRGLEIKGLITARSCRSGTKKYCPTPGLMSASIPQIEHQKDEESDTRPRLKLPLGPVRVTAKPGRIYRKVRSNLPTKEEDIKKRILKMRILNRPSGTSGQDLTKNLEGIVARSANVREARLTKGHISTLTGYWFQQAKEYFPENHFAPFLERNRGEFKLLLSRLDGMPPKDFIHYVFQDWDLIVKSKLDWMRKPPAVPELWCLIRYTGKLLEAVDVLRAGRSLTVKSDTSKQDDTEKSVLRRKLAVAEKRNEYLERRVVTAEVKSETIKRESERERTIARIAADTASVNAGLYAVPSAPKRPIKPRPQRRIPDDFEPKPWRD